MKDSPCRIRRIRKSSSPSLLYASVLASRCPYRSPDFLYLIFDLWTGSFIAQFNDAKSAAFHRRLLSRDIGFYRYRVVRYARG